MADERRSTPGGEHRDASDVLDGDIGEARLKEPSEANGADLDALKDIAPTNDDPESRRSADRSTLPADPA